MNTPACDTSDCGRIRPQLDDYASGELPSGGSEEVARHLEKCEPCSRELNARIQLRRALRRSVQSLPVPGSLAGEVQDQINESRVPFFWPRNLTSWAVAMPGIAILLVAFLTAGLWFMFHNGEKRVASILKLGVADHLHCAIDAHNYPDVANQPAQIMHKLGPEYAPLLQVVEEHMSGFQVLEGHICSVPGRKRRYVHLIARGHGTIVSVILTRRQNESFPSGRLFAASAYRPFNLYRAHLNGMDVAGFETKGYFGYVVADLGQSEVLHLANVLAGPIRDALGGRAMPGATKASNSIPSFAGNLAWNGRRRNNEPQAHRAPVTSFETGTNASRRLSAWSRGCTSAVPSGPRRPTWSRV